MEALIKYLIDFSLPIIGTLITSGGIFGFIYHKQNKRNKELQNSMIIDDRYQELIDYLQKTIDENRKRNLELLQRLDDITNKYNKSEHDITLLNAQLVYLDNLYKLKRCDKLTCKYRCPIYDEYCINDNNKERSNTLSIDNEYNMKNIIDIEDIDFTK